MNIRTTNLQKFVAPQHQERSNPSLSTSNSKQTEAYQDSFVGTTFSDLAEEDKKVKNLFIGGMIATALVGYHNPLLGAAVSLGTFFGCVAVASR